MLLGLAGKPPVHWEVLALEMLGLRTMLGEPYKCELMSKPSFLRAACRRYALADLGRGKAGSRGDTGVSARCSWCCERAMRSERA